MDHARMWFNEQFSQMTITMSRQWTWLLHASQAVTAWPWGLIYLKIYLKYTTTNISTANLLAFCESITLILIFSELLRNKSNMADWRSSKRNCFASSKIAHTSFSLNQLFASAAKMAFRMHRRQCHDLFIAYIYTQWSRNRTIYSSRYIHSGDCVGECTGSRLWILETSDVNVIAIC